MCIPVSVQCGGGGRGGGVLLKSVRLCLCLRAIL